MQLNRFIQLLQVHAVMLNLKSLNYSISKLLFDNKKNIISLHAYFYHKKHIQFTAK
jgi:hypothetical protein